MAYAAAMLTVKPDAWHFFRNIQTEHFRENKPLIYFIKYINHVNIL